VKRIKVWRTGFTEPVLYRARAASYGADSRNVLIYGTVRVEDPNQKLADVVLIPLHNVWLLTEEDW
jgi:hypothetical protein